MTTGTNPGSAGASPLTPAEEALQRRLKMLVIGLGALLVIGLLVIVGRIFYMAARGGSQTQTAGSATLAPEAIVSLPAGAVVRSLALSGNRLAVHFDTPAGSGIRILDLESGRAVSSIRLMPEPPRQ